MAPFDPYHIWLGIPETERPISKYRLLGITDFENNRGVISAAAERQTIYLRTLQAGEHEVLVAQLLNEVSQARVCLLDGKSKSRYDTQLRSDLEPTPEQDPLAFAAEELAAISSRPSTRQRSRGGKPVWKEPWAIPAGAGGIVVLLLLIMMLFGSGEEPQESGQGQEQELRAEIASLKQKLVTAGNSKSEENAELAKQNTELSQQNAGLKTELKELALQKSATSLANEASKKQIPDDAVSFGGHRYLLVDRGVTWSAAMRESEQRGGYLVKLDSVQEHEFLINHLNEKPPKNENGHIWINGSRLIDGGKYLFTDDRPVDFSKMRTTPFSRPEGREMFLAMFEPHGWHVQDVVFHHKGFHAFIIEWADDEHTTTFTRTGLLPASLQEGLVAYYPFNGNAKDESGNGNHGEVHGAILESDRHGNANQAYLFDGVDDYIKCPSIFEKYHPLSMSAWIKVKGPYPNTRFQYSVLSKPRSETGGGFNLCTTKDRVHAVLHRFQNSNNRNTEMDVYVPELLGRWHFLSFTNDGKHRAITGCFNRPRDSILRS
jgi:hypothetical protein